MNENKRIGARAFGRDPQAAGRASRASGRRPYAAPRIELLGTGLAGALMSDIQGTAGASLFGTSGTPLSSGVDGI